VVAFPSKLLSSLVFEGKLNPSGADSLCDKEDDISGVAGEEVSLTLSVSVEGSWETAFLPTREV